MSLRRQGESASKDEPGAPREGILRAGESERMASIGLSRVPKAGHELEDYVAGMFQAAGYFVEKNIRRRDVDEVLELDAVATSYEGPVPMAVLAEAKGGRWGFPDIFKVAGWMAYLGIERGGFFVRTPFGAGAGPRDLERVQRTIAPLGVALVDLGDFRDPARCLGARGFRPLRDPLLLDIWRLAFRVERALLEGLRQRRRAQPEQRGPHAVLAYHDLVNDHAFFLRDVGQRLRRLYGAYRSHPKLSLALAGELAGGPFDVGARLPHGPAAARILSEALYTGAHPALQGSFYVEHRARLSILKAAVDLACFEAAGRPESRCGLPASFRAGLARLRRCASHRRWALLWQVFLWGLGGFYLADRAEEEFALLADQTGIPIDEIPEGLRAFDELFPMRGSSWIVPVRGTPLRVAKLVPAALRGVGAVQRLRRRGARNYDGFGVGPEARRSLIGWHNALVRLLAGTASTPDRAVR